MTFRTPHAVMGAALCLTASCHDRGPTAPSSDAPFGLRIERAGPAESNEFLADGTTIINVTVSLPDDLKTEARKVSFATTAGTFLEGGAKDVSLVPTIDGRATAALRAPVDASSARLRVTVGSIARDTTIAFAIAKPDTLVLEPERFVVKANGTDEIKVNVSFRRSSGRVTAGAVAALAAFDSTGEQPIAARVNGPVTSDANGAAAGRFFAGSIPYRGRATIRATLVDSTGSRRVVGATTVEIVP